MPEPETPNSPPPWKRLCALFAELASKLYPVVDVLRTIWGWVADEIREGAGDMRKGWHLFLLLAVLEGCICFYAGCEVQEFFDRPAPSKIVQWQSPELPTNTENFSLLVGGNLDSDGQYRNKNGFLVNWPIKKIQSKNGYPISIGDYKPIVARFIKNRIYLELSVPTKTMPIAVSGGKSTPLPEGWDWNANSNELEIVDNHWQAVFQETYVTNNFIWVNGALHSGGHVLLTANIGPSLLQNSNVVPVGRFNAEDTDLTTKFRYPSEKFFGRKIGE